LDKLEKLAKKIHETSFFLVVSNLIMGLVLWYILVYSVSLFRRRLVFFYKEKKSCFLTVKALVRPENQKMAIHFMEAVGFTVSIVLIVSFILSLTSVWVVLRFSNNKKWFDHTNERKIHNGNIPRLGGIGFAVIFIFMVMAVSFLLHESASSIHNLPCLIALLLILFFGIIDDFRPLRPSIKFLLQIVAALIVIIPGFIFKRIAYFDIFILPEPLGYAITLLWIVGIANAFNLIDGIDGLAGGLSALIAVFLGLIFFSYGHDYLMALYCVVLVGVVAGFLVFNAPLPKAKIFMGDCGSQFLGFLLAVLPLLERQDNPANLPVPYAAALLIIPIFDTTAAVWRRIRDGQKISDPDKSHVHHKLLNLGLSVRGVVAVLCGLQIILGVLVLISIRLEGLLSLYVLGASYLIGIAFFAVVHFRNRAVMKYIRSQGVPLPSAHTDP